MVKEKDRSYKKLKSESARDFPMKKSITPGSKSKRRKPGRTGRKRKVEAADTKATEAEEPASAVTSLPKNQTFEVEFQFFDPEEDDFHGVRDLLCSGTLGFCGTLDFSGLANSIVGQVNIGTMVKSGPEEATANPDEDVTLCGMLTILNVRQFAEETWCKNLSALLESKAKSEKQILQYTRPSGTNQVGLIVFERFVNLPLEVIPAMHNAILEDIQWSCTTEYCPPEESSIAFCQINAKE